MQREGKIRHIGISETSVDEYERCKKSATIVSIQNLFNVQDRSAEPVLQACERDGIAFLPWFPLGGKGTPKHDALDKIAARGERDADTDRPRMAARPVARDTSDSGHVVDRAFR